MQAAEDLLPETLKRKVAAQPQVAYSIPCVPDQASQE